MSENNLNMIISIAEIILFITLSIVAVYLIISLKKFLASISRIENEVVEISDQLTPVITDMKFITDDIKAMVDRSRLQFGKIENMTEEFVEKGSGLLNAINKVESVTNGFLFNITNLVTAVTKGFKTFGNKLKNGSPLKLKSSDQFSQ
jgi:uncharacterized protein (UPF0335 family)